MPAPLPMRAHSTLTDREHSRIALPAGRGEEFLAPAPNHKHAVGGTERVIRTDAPGSVDARSAP